MSALAAAGLVAACLAVSALAAAIGARHVHRAWTWAAAGAVVAIVAAALALRRRWHHHAPGAPDPPSLPPSPPGGRGGAPEPGRGVARRTSPRLQEAAPRPTRTESPPPAAPKRKASRSKLAPPAAGAAARGAPQVSPRKCPACDEMITPERQTDYMWRKALAQHLNGPAHGMAMAPELQAMIAREGLHRCPHCRMLFGNRAQQHIFQCEQRASPPREDKYADVQPTNRERGQRERAEQRDRRLQGVAPDTTGAFEQLQHASPRASVEGGSEGGTPTGCASHADSELGSASVGGSPSGGAPGGLALTPQSLRRLRSPSEMLRFQRSAVDELRTCAERMLPPSPLGREVLQDARTYAQLYGRVEVGDGSPARLLDLSEGGGAPSGTSGDAAAAEAAAAADAAAAAGRRRARSARRVRGRRQRARRTRPRPRQRPRRASARTTGTCRHRSPPPSPSCETRCRPTP